MNFFYDENVGENSLILEGDNFTHVIKSRRSKVDDVLAARNFKDNTLYFYKVIDISKKKANLEFVSKEIKEVGIAKELHIAWSVVDPKTVEKTLPFLNELGVSKISFFYASRSQKNIKINLERCEKILINSSCQCGRSSIIDLKVYNSLEEFLQEFPDANYLDFGGDTDFQSLNEPIIIGPEGGFAEDDLTLLKNNKKLGLEHSLILRSETAAIAIATKGIL